MSRRRVLIVHRLVSSYRIALFERLRAQLAHEGTELVLGVGTPTRLESARSIDASLPWAHPLPTRFLFGERICWLPFGTLAHDTDLVVLTAENKLLYNLYAQYLCTGRRIALWGHGANLQGDPRSLRERFKRRVARRADWWFAYTEHSVPLVESSGFPRERITVLDNAIDTRELHDQWACVGAAEAAVLRASIGLRGHNVAAYIGSLYEVKRIGFLLEAAAAIRRRIPDFELLVVGEGPERDKVATFARAHPWTKYLGVKTGRAKAEVLALARLMLNPGAVGLGILDTFACAAPIVTTACGQHGPEIAYLANGKNGVMTENRLDAYVEAVCALLADRTALEVMRANCGGYAHRYTLENMVDRFAEGIRRCLQTPILRGAPA